MVSFVVVGDPKPQPRPKAARIGGFIRIYTPSTAKVWKAAVAAEAKKHLKKALAGPLVVDLFFRFERPKSHLGSSGLRPSAPVYHTKRPDVDNLAKAVLDALTDVGLWADDSQVIGLRTFKNYCPPGEKPGCTVLITPAE